MQYECARSLSKTRKLRGSAVLDAIIVKWCLSQHLGVILHDMQHLAVEGNPQEDPRLPIVYQSLAWSSDHLSLLVYSLFLLVRQWRIQVKTWSSFPSQLPPHHSSQKSSAYLCPLTKSLCSGSLTAISRRMCTIQKVSFLASLAFLCSFAFKWKLIR